MRLEVFLANKIRKDLQGLFNSYIRDEEDIDEISYLENKIIDLDNMTIEKLIDANLEYVDANELQGFINEYIGEYLNKFSKIA